MHSRRLVCVDGYGVAVFPVFEEKKNVIKMGFRRSSMWAAQLVA